MPENNSAGIVLLKFVQLANKLKKPGCFGVLFEPFSVGNILPRLPEMPASCLLLLKLIVPLE